MWRLQEDHPKYQRCKYNRHKQRFILIVMELPDKKLFKTGWLHPDTVPVVTAIFLTSKSELQSSFRGQRFDKWRYV
jgi:hypothetical protein